MSGAICELHRARVCGTAKQGALLHLESNAQAGSEQAWSTKAIDPSRKAKEYQKRPMIQHIVAYHIWSDTL